MQNTSKLIQSRVLTGKMKPYVFTHTAHNKKNIEFDILNRKEGKLCGTTKSKLVEISIFFKIGLVGIFNFFFARQITPVENKQEV